MGMGARGSFMISWAQTVIDGDPAKYNQELVEGMSWSWHGRSLPLKGDGAVLLLTASRDYDDLRARAARVVRKMLHKPALTPEQVAAEDADPLFKGAFVISDGAKFFSVVPIEIADGAPPILLFPDDIPPSNKTLSIVQASKRVLPALDAEAASVICFTPGTRIRTAQGEVAIEDLGPGDRVLTRDDGEQEVLWSGHRRMSGARLFAMPDQRPIRMRRGALGIDRPDSDLIVSPDHRVLMRGAQARELWGEPEVLVRAADLVGDRFVTVDHSLRETWYVHLMLERHEVIWANGLEVETFHPGYMGLDHLEGLQRKALVELRPELASDPQKYGAPARRMVSRGEAAILMAHIH